MKVLETKPSIATAVHEVGHAAAALELNRLDWWSHQRIEYITVEPDDYNLGHIRATPRVPYLLREDHNTLCGATVQSIYLDCIYALAGPIAEIIWRAGGHGLCSGVNILSWKERIRSGVDLPPDSDWSYARRWITLLLRENIYVNVDNIFEAALAVIIAQRPAIISLARILLDRKMILGEEFSSDWQRIRSGSAEEKARLQRAKLSEPSALFPPVQLSPDRMSSYKADYLPWSKFAVATTNDHPPR